MKGAKHGAEKTKKSIEEEKKRLEDQNGGEHARRLEEVQEAREHAEALKTELETHSAAKQGLKAQKDEAVQKAQDTSPNVTEKQQAVQNAEGMLQNLGRNAGQQNGGYDPRLPNLLRAIQAETRFRDRPVGPIGQHVRLKPSKTEWGSILERIFGQTLSAFVVTNKADQTLLNDISRRVKYNCTVFIGDGQPLDISNSQPDAQYDTVLRILDIRSDLVRNQLIINNAIEQTVLIKDQDEAFNFINRNPQGRPRNTKSCLAFHPKHRGYGIRYTASATSARADPIKAWDQTPRLQSDTEAQKRYVMESDQGR